MANNVLGHLADKHIHYEKVLPNWTNHFKYLNFNRPAEHFLKKKFVDWFAKQVISRIESGCNIDDINVDLKMSILKPLNASWINQATLKALDDFKNIQKSTWSNVFRYVRVYTFWKIIRKK